MTLDRTDCENLRVDIDVLSDELFELEDQIEDEQEFLDEIEQVRAELEESESLEDALQKLLDLLAEKQYVEELLRDINIAIDDVNDEIDYLEQRIDTLEVDHNRFCLSVATLSINLDDIHDEIHQYLDYLSEIDRELNLNQPPAERARLLQERSNVRQTLDQLVRQHDQIVDQLDLARMHCEGTGNALENLKDRLREKKADRRTLWQQREEKDELLLRIEAEIAVCTDLLRQIEALIEQVISWFTDRPVTLEEKKQRAAELDHKFWDRIAEFESHCGDYFDR